MQRREFIKKSALMGSWMLVNPGEILNPLPKYTQDELIGKATIELSGTTYKLRPEVAEQFEKMKADAKKEGIQMVAASTYRSYKYQNGIWEKKYKDFTQKGSSAQQAIEKIITYSSIPGTSRHHWGTDLDIIDEANGIPEHPLNEIYFNEGGRMRKFKLWMEENAAKYGFYLVYTNAPNRKGFAYEPWHFSYKPLSLDMLKDYKNLDIKTILQTNKLMGSDHFTDDFIARYTKEQILDINPDLLPDSTLDLGI